MMTIALLGFHTILFNMQVSVRWKAFFQRIPRVQVFCNIFSVTPVAPDPVENVVLTFVETITENSQLIVTLRYSWTSPTFPGEGITGFQIWLGREPAPATLAEEKLQEAGASEHSAETRAVFQATTDSFNLYLQVILTSERGTRRGQYKFTCFVICRAIILFLEVVKCTKTRGRVNIWDLKQCPL